MSKTSTEELIALIHKQSGQPGKKFPVTVRQQVMDYVEAQRRSGVTWKALAETLGIKQQTLFRWRKLRLQQSETKTTQAFVPIRVSEKHKPRSIQSISLQSPSGYRIEGLSVETAAQLLARLR